MAFDARGWRKIVVGGGVFYWQPADGEDLLHARPEHAPHRLLRVSPIVSRDASVRQSWVTPGCAGGAVEHAVSLGWPDEPSRMRVYAIEARPLNVWRFVGPDPRWLTPTVVALAVSIFNDSAYDRMPILADALEEAGCDNPDVLRDCRGDAPHVRGWWVVNLLLGK